MLSERRSESLLYLKTVDRYTGSPVTHTVFYREIGNEYVIVASNETETYKPDWYLNLKEEPIVEVELDGMHFYARASTPVGSERMQIWPLVEELSQYIERHLPRNVTGVLLSPMQ